MKNERWDTIEALFHAARELQGENRISFLNKECGADGAMRRQVEALLRGDERTDGILNSMPDRIALETRIGPYEVTGWLGAGGMGEVYRARDPRLARDVAIKLLPESLASDQIRMHRFEQEARAAGQLNHPNILTAYDVGLHAGTPYIVSELLEGQSLRSMLSDGALPVRKAIDFARQIAEGLAAAHDKGVIHRDIKPENIFVTSEGRVKILDFGLAKFTKRSDDAASAKSNANTQEGTVMGTVSYMSPEQVRGEVVDHRSDIFSFGVVLHELLTGRPTFARESAADTMAAILKEDPPDPTPTGISPALARIVSRCLEKACEGRFQSARDLAFGLEHLSGEVRNPKLVAPATDRLTLLRRRDLPWVVAGVLGLGAAATAVWKLLATNEDPLSNLKPQLLTPRRNGTNSAGQISPDGQYAAFVSDDAPDGEFNIYHTDIHSGIFTNMTEAFPDRPIPGPANMVRSFGYTRNDPLGIWFSPPEKRSTMFSQDAPSNTEPKLVMPIEDPTTTKAYLKENTEALAWSRDKEHLAYFTTDSGDNLFVADSNGGSPVPVLEKDPPATMHNHNPTWSPDGKWIYFVRGDEPTVKTDIWRVHPVERSREVRLTDQNAAVNFLAPINDRTVLYTARDPNDWSGPWLWALDVENKTTRRLQTGVDQCVCVSASADGRRVIVTLAKPPTVRLWKVPLTLDQEAAKETDVKLFEMSSYRPHAPRFIAADTTGKSMFYLSARETVDGLWQWQAGKKPKEVSSSNEALFEPPAVSHDGKRIVVAIRQNGKRHLKIMYADGSDPRPLAPSIVLRGSAGQGLADWLDDNWIVASGIDTKEKEPRVRLFKIPVNGGDHSVLYDKPAVNPVVSPLGNLIAYSSPLKRGQSELHFIDSDGKSVDSLPQHLQVRQGSYRFLPDGRGVVFIPVIQGPSDFWLINLATGEFKRQTELSNKGAIQTFDITTGPDGRFQIIFDRTHENSGIALIEFPK